jgi:hypothetical protein
MNRYISRTVIIMQMTFMCVFFQVNAQTGSNPIFRNNFTADPAPLVYNGRLYVYVGHDEAKDGELFTMTGWLCYSTTDMKNWTYHGTIMKPTDFSWGAADAWASQVVHKDGKFYLYVTVTGKNPYGGRNIGVAVSDSPTGPFVDARGTPLVRDNMTNNGKTWDDIDPTVLIDDDGTAYLCWGNPICYLTKLKPNMTELDGSIKMITPPNYAEGPWLHKRNDIYYLTYPAFVAPVGSEQICYSTATNINGPWTHRGILSGAAKNSYTIHPGIVEYKGQWYFFYHNATLTLNGQGPATGRRSVCVEYLCYNADGTIKPITQTTAGITVTSPCPPPAVKQSPYKGIIHTIPGRIEAEEYDEGGQDLAFNEMNTGGNQGGATLRNDEVDIEKTADATGVYNVGYILKGEWLEYTVNVTETGNFSLDLRVAANDAGKTLHVDMDGKNISGTVSIPGTGGWQEWETVTVNNLSLTRGEHIMRVAFDSDYMNLNFLEFKKEVVTGFVAGTNLNGSLISPNPFEDNFRIKFQGQFSYMIYDLSGSLVQHGSGTEETTAGDTLKTGFYLLQVSGSDRVIRMKICKK